MNNPRRTISSFYDEARHVLRVYRKPDGTAPTYDDLGLTPDVIRSLHASGADPINVVHERAERMGLRQRGDDGFSRNPGASRGGRAAAMKREASASKLRDALNAHFGNASLFSPGNGFTSLRDQYQQPGAELVIEVEHDDAVIRMNLEDEEGNQQGSSVLARFPVSDIHAIAAFLRRYRPSVFTNPTSPGQFPYISQYVYPRRNRALTLVDFADVLQAAVGLTPKERSLVLMDVGGRMTRLLPKAEAWFREKGLWPPQGEVEAAAPVVTSELPPADRKPTMLRELLGELDTALSAGGDEAMIAEFRSQIASPANREAYLSVLDL